MSAAWSFVSALGLNLSTISSTAVLFLVLLVELYHRQPWIPRAAMAIKISDKVYNLCRSTSTVSSELAKDPTLSPGKAASRLYDGDEKISVLEKKPPTERVSATPEDLERAYQCGKFGATRPSELFLRIFHDAVCTLEHDPLMGVASPPLMGSCGVLPLTIIGPLPDVCRHIVRRDRLFTGR